MPEDIERKIARVRAHLAELADADVRCLSELRGLAQELTAVHQRIPETELLGRPSVLERGSRPSPELPLDHDQNWHAYSSPKLMCEGLQWQITFNPVRGAWVTTLNNKQISMSRDEAVESYTDELAKWVILKYPVLKKKHNETVRHQESERDRYQEELQERARRKEIDEEISRENRERIERGFFGALGLGCLIIIVLFLLLLAYNLNYPL